MNLIRPHVEVLDWLGQTPVMPRLEACGRTAYKSEGRIAPGTAEPFVAGIVRRGHLSVVEHHRFCTLWLAPEWDTVYEVRAWMDMADDVQQVQEFTEGLVTERIDHAAFLSWNTRTLLEALHRLPRCRLVQETHLVAATAWPSLFPPASPPTDNDARYAQQTWGSLRLATADEVCTRLRAGSAARLLPATLRFVVDRGVLAEFTRHRKFSFSVESTRFVNYGKAGHCTFVIPPWAPHVQDGEMKRYEDVKTGESDPAANSGISHWAWAMHDANQRYLRLVGDYNWWTPQQARSVLPNSTKTEICMTGTLERWRDMLKLRVANDAHPQAAEVAIPALWWFQAQPGFGPYFADIQVGDKWRDLRLAKVYASGESQT